MTPEMILTMIVLAFAIALFVFEWVRVDVVGIIMMVMLPLLGLISPREAFVGLSSNAVCSIIAGQRIFKVASPTITRIMVITQKRTMTRDSGQPFSSK